MICEKAKMEKTADNVLDLRFFRKRNLPYFIIWVAYYAWVIAFATWWTTTSHGEVALTDQTRSLMHAANLISSAVFVFIVRKEWVVWLSRASAALVIAGIFAFFLFENDSFSIPLAILSSVAIGSLNICILIPYVFALNNTEKLYAVVGTNALTQILSLLLWRSTYVKLELALSLSLLILSFGATWFFRRRDILPDAAQSKPAAPVLPRRIYLTVLFNCLIAILCKGVGKGILNVAEAGAGVPLMPWYFLGGLVGCVLFAGLYLVTKRAYLFQANLTFAFVAMGLFCNAFAGYSSGFAVAFALLVGAGGTMGMINMYYVIGVIGKKYDSIRYVRLSILLVGVCGGVSGVVVGNLISTANNAGVSIAASLISAAVLILLIITSPIVAQSTYERDWAQDAQHSEVDNEQLYLFREYGLSRRETEVCKMLLQGFTLRQISGALSIAYPTVNTYCTGIYRKVGINSRVELMQVFKEYTEKLH